MISNDINVLHNPMLRIWDYGNGPFTSDGDRLANRWTLRVTDGSVSVAPVTFGSSTGFPKLYRSEQGMRVTVSTTGTHGINQFVPDMEGNAPVFVALTIIVFGPDGATFECGVNVMRDVVTCRGASEPVTHQAIFAIDDISTAGGQGEVVLCENFDTVGDYDFAFAQLEYLRPDQSPAPITPVPILYDRVRMAPFVQVLTGVELTATATDRVRAAISTAPVEMRAAPTLVAVVTSNLDLRDLEAATADTAATPSYTFDQRDAWGGRLVISGFSGLTVGRQYRLEGEPLLLDADY